MIVETRMSIHDLRAKNWNRQVDILIHFKTVLDGTIIAFGIMATACIFVGCNDKKST